MKHTYNLVIAVGTVLLLSAAASAQNVGVDVATPQQKLDVAGALKVGNTTNGVAGSLRWTGSEFQFHNGTQWVTLNANTDDQMLDVIQLTGTTLQISLENDGQVTHNVDLSSLVGTDDQTFDQVTINGSNQLLLSLENDGQPTHVLDLSGYLDNTDDQGFDVIALNGTDLQLSIESDATPTHVIDLSAFMDNTDDQTIDQFAINSNVLQLSLENDGQPLQQVDLSPYLDNTDNQIMDVALLTGTELRLSLENDGVATNVIDLSGFMDNTDDQQISIAPGNVLTLEDGGTVNLTPYLDNTDDQVFDVITINPSNQLLLSLEGDNQGTHVLDLSGYLDNTDDQNLSGSLTGATLEIDIEDGTTATVNLDPLRRQLIDADADTKVQVEAGPDEDIIRFSTAGSEQVVIDAAGNVGIGVDAPVSNMLAVKKDPNDAASALSLRSGSTALVYSNAAQIAFGFDNTATDQHFIHTRHNDVDAQNNAIDFYVNNATVSNNTVSNGSTHVMTLEAGNVGIGTTDPGAKLQVQGSGTIGGANLGNSWVLAGTPVSGLGMDPNELYFRGADGNFGVIGNNSLNIVVNGGTRIQVAPNGVVRIPSLNQNATSFVMANGNGDLYTISNLAGTGLGDNLGNHSATTNLDMNALEIDDVRFVDVTAGNGNGMRFWQSNDYKIHMGNAAENQYGDVQDYSIKMNMNNDPEGDRGWTWGVSGQTPVFSVSTAGHATLDGALYLDCVTCGSTTDPYPTAGSGWGNMVLQGRVVSANSNIHLSPPAGSSVIIDDNYRAAGGSSSGTAGLTVERLAGGGNRTVFTDNSGNLYAANMDGSGLGDNLGDHVADQNLNMNGFDVDFIRGDQGQIRSVGRISFDWTGGTYDDSRYHGIESKNESGGFEDDIRINSYDNIITTLDANNNNSTSYFKIQGHAIGDGTDYWWSNTDGDMYNRRYAGFGTGPVSGYAIYSTGTSYGILAFGSTMGGRFEDSNSSARVYCGYGSYDIYANGTGRIDATSQMRAPIFYDLNDANYYANPNGVSIFNDMRARIYYDLDNTYWYLDPSGGMRITGQSEIARNSGYTYVANAQSWGYCNGCYSSAFGCCASNWWGCTQNCYGVNCSVCGRTVYSKMSVNGGMYSYAYWTTSDKKYKSDVSTIPHALNYIKQVRGVTYKLIDPEEETSNYDQNPDMGEGYMGPQIGFIAQELQEVLPQLVHEEEIENPETGEKEQKIGVAYGQMTALLVEGMKEQQKMIEQLQAEIASLKAGAVPSIKSETETEVEKALRQMESNMDQLSSEHQAEMKKFMDRIRGKKVLSNEEWTIIGKMRHKFGLE